MEHEILDLAHSFSGHAAAMMPLLERYGYAGIFVAALVEGFGIPAPGQTLLTLGALLAARGEFDIATVVALTWCATVIGNLIGSALGRRAGRRLLLSSGVRRARIRRVEQFVRRYGPVLQIFRESRRSNDSSHVYRRSAGGRFPSFRQ
jgi:membrane protein DedA with SNARE-associated domain